jgi:hypothetical protein
MYTYIHTYIHIYVYLYMYIQEQNIIPTHRYEYTMAQAAYADVC